MLNRICAHSEIIACALGACLFDAVFFGWVFYDTPLRVVAPNWKWMLYLFAAAVPAATLFGCLFLGMMFISHPMRAICSRINGAPLRTGDQVVILSGPHKGTTAKVYDIYRGQGGWELARLDLGTEARERCRDIFEEYSVLRTHMSKPDRAVTWAQLAEDSGKPLILLLMCAYPGVATLMGMLAVSAASVLLILCLLHGAPSRNIALYILGCLFLLVLTAGLVPVVCSRIRGAPFKPGDQVIILSGAFRGIAAEVSGIVLQNEGPAVFLDLGLEDKHSFDEKSLLKIRKNEPGGAGNGRQPSDEN